MQPQARSDGSQLAGPVQATQRKPEEGSTVQGKEGPALHGRACPPCPRASPRSGCRAHSEERTAVGTEPSWALLPPSLAVCCTHGSHSYNALCKQTEDFLLSCHVGAAAAAYPAMERPP